MNVVHRIAVALAVALVLPCAAAAEDPATPAAPLAAPDAAAPWTIGAGMGWRTGIWSSGVGSGFDMPQGLLTATGSLERRIGARSWLVLGLSGQLSRRRDSLPAGARGVDRRDIDALSLTAGLRRPLTPAGAPLEVSVVVLAEGGMVHDVQHGGVYAMDAIELAENAWFAGANVGLAVDRELTRGLALRVATRLVEATYVRSRLRTTGQPVATSRELSLGAVIAPTLELRLAF